MILNFLTMEEKPMEHFKNGEGTVYLKLAADDQNRMMRGRLPQGATIGMHTHDTSSEVVYILSGTAKFIMDGQEEIVPAGNGHYCPKGHTHMLMNGGTEDVIFYAVVPQQ